MSALPKWTPGEHVPADRPIRALLLDDSSFDRRRIRRYSEKSRLHVEFTEAPDLKSMERALEQGVFDLFLLDYQLPEGNGLRAVEMIRRTAVQSDAAVIMITGQQHREVAVEAMREGCHDLIPKDEMSPAMLRERMSAALARVRGTSVDQARLQEPLQRALRKAMQSEAMQQLLEDGLRRAIRQEYLPTGLSEAGRIDALLGSYLEVDDFHFRT